MRPDSDLTALYAEAAAATAAGSKSFYFATKFFPSDLARAAHAVYWFCRTTDDIVDEAESTASGRLALDDWEAAVRSGFAGGKVELPVLRAFFDAARQHGIEEELAMELIAGVRMDLDHVRYGKLEELLVFCRRVASTVGLMMCKLIGFRRPELESRGVQHAVELGIAMQLTNILRDVGEDLTLNRIYLPAEEMREFGYSEDDLKACVRNDAFRRLIQFQIRRARDYYSRAEPGIAMLDPRGAFAVRMAADVYRDILDAIERNDYDVFSRRAVVPSSRKYRLVAGALLSRLVAAMPGS